MKRTFIILGLLLSLTILVEANDAMRPTPEKAASWPLLLNVNGNIQEHLLPLKLRLLGFSRSGRIALLEQRESEEAGTLWFLRIIDLNNDYVRVEQEFDAHDSAMNAFWKHHAEEVNKILAANEIEPSPMAVLYSFPLQIDGNRISLKIQRGLKTEEGSTPHEVWLQSRHGKKLLGILNQWDIESGRNLAGPPIAVGALQSPWEPRLAVLIRQDETGVEAAVTPQVRVLGTRLDSRWQAPH